MLNEITQVMVVPYDPNWPVLFKTYSSKIREALGAIAIRIDHIGSTAVPGCSAKLVIDIQVSVERVENERLYTKKLESIGYIFRLREPGHVVFILHQNDNRLVNLHLCKAGSEWEQQDRMFRDFLRAMPNIVVEYSRLKKELAKKYSRLEDYYKAKDPYIKKIKKKAEQWARTSGWDIGPSDA